MRMYLKEMRLKKGESQRSIAKKAGIGQTYYGYIENGERQRDISLDLLQKLSQALEVPLNDLIQKELEYKQNLS